MGRGSMDEQQLNRYNRDRLESRQIDELMGLASGLVADGVINEEEVRFLHGWLASNMSISKHPLLSGLFNRVQEILSDDVVDEQEREDLLWALRNFSAEDREGGEAVKSSTLPLCDPLPALSFEGKRYCFTGTFNYGQRKHCQKAATERGAMAGSLTKKTDVLVIGVYATESWKHSSFGNKILKAVDMRSAGVPISIVSEPHWVSHL
ncbi:NAD-dependent DNA ligase [Erythrobacter sp. HI00D59]|nr:NAD-dependent DNA ligase [Erythrobacter sp. HI00D59]